MKKISVFLAFMLTFLFSACSSSMFDKLVEAYESSTKELASVKGTERSVYKTLCPKIG